MNFSVDLITFTKEMLNGKLHFFAVLVLIVFVQMKCQITGMSKRQINDTYYFEHAKRRTSGILDNQAGPRE